MTRTLTTLGDLYAGWQGDDTELALIQQQLDPRLHGKITRDRLLQWLQDYYNANEVMERVRISMSERGDNSRNTSDTDLIVDKPSESEATAVSTLASKCQIINRSEGEHLDDDPKCSASRAPIACSPMDRDWNREYYDLLSETSALDPFVRGVRVAALLSEFRAQAETLVHDIVDDLALPDAIKRIKPLTDTAPDEFLATDGVSSFGWISANLSRYYRGGLLAYVLMRERAGTCGALTEQDEIAFRKLLGHQLRAARVLHDATQEVHITTRLRVPVQCTVDYIGFRVFVVASQALFLESKHDKLASMLSKDQGERTIQDLKSLFDHVGLLTERLGPTQVARDNTQQASSHISFPDFYPTDAGMLVHPNGDSPVLELQNLGSLLPAVVGGNTLDNPEDIVLRLRPEFVRQFGLVLPLDSNMSNIPSDQASSDPTVLHEAEILQAAIHGASQHLSEVLVPSFVLELEESIPALVYPSDITDTMHAAGINVRYLGECFALTTRPDVRQLLLTEMLARVGKVEYSILLSELVHDMISQSSAGGEPLDSQNENQGSSDGAGDDGEAAHTLIQQHALQMTVEFFNLMMGMASIDSKAFWEEKLLPSLHKKFRVRDTSMTFETIASGTLLHLPRLFYALQAHTHVSLSDHMSYNFHSLLPFEANDVLCIGTSTHVLANTTVECKQALASTDELIASEQIEAAVDLVKLRLSIVDPTTSDTSVFCRLLVQAADLSLRLDQLEDARRYCSLALDTAPAHTIAAAMAHVMVMKLDGYSKDLVAVETHFALAVDATKWHLGESCMLLGEIYMTMVDVVSSVSQLDRASEVLAQCVDLVRTTFGKSSHEYADVRRRQGIMMLEANANTATDTIIGVFHDAAVIYEAHFRDATGDVRLFKHLASSCYYLSAVAKSDDLSSHHGIEDAYSLALKALALRKEVLSSDHHDILASLIQLATLSRHLGEPFRAVEYYRQALALVKQRQDDSNIDHVRDVSRSMLQTFFATLPSEQQEVRTRCSCAILDWL